MKLCRFELSQAPGLARSGIFHDGRVYETDGEKAIGVHDPGKVRFLAPVAAPPALRIFEPGPTFRYGNGSAILDPDAEIDAPPGIGDLEPEIRVAVVVRDEGEQISADEADEFVLGFTLALGFVGADLLTTDFIRAVDMPIVVGPLLTTPDELTTQSFAIRLNVNGDLVWSGSHEMSLSTREMLVAASRNLAVRVADLMLAPPMALPLLSGTALRRGLRPRDTVQVVAEPLGALSAAIV